MIKQFITASALVGMMSHAYAMPEIAGEIQFGAAVGAQAFVDVEAGTLIFDPTDKANAVVTIASGIFADEQGGPAFFESLDLATVPGSTLWRTENFEMIIDGYEFETVEDGSRITFFGDGEATFLDTGEALPYDGSWTLSLDSSNGGAELLVLLYRYRHRC